MKIHSDEYGTPQFYAELFSDIMADVGTGIRQRDEQVALAMMQGFQLAIEQWLSYHEDCARSYQDLHRRFMGIYRDEQGSGESDDNVLWGPFGDLRQGDLEGNDPSPA